MDCIKAYAPRNDGGEGGAMMVGRGGMVESGVSLRTNVKQSRMVGNGLPHPNGLAMTKGKGVQ